MTYRVLIGDCIEQMRTLPDQSVHTCVTSPPYYGLRDYGRDGQVGMEETPDAYVAKMVYVFREVRRVLRDDGTLWLNLGDTYAGAERGGNPPDSPHQKQATSTGSYSVKDRPLAVPPGLKRKDLIGVPWRVAFALQADGWYLRQDIIWQKPNPMPESVNDRCTKAHEYIFMLSKSAKYFYDGEAIKEPAVSGSAGKCVDGGSDKQRGHSRRHAGFNGRYAERVARDGPPDTRNKRSVWSVATKPYSGAHFATFPPDLIEPCILAGCPSGGTVLDPFGGSGTTAGVAVRNGRDAILCELNQDYVDMMRDRIASITGGLFESAAKGVANSRDCP